MHSDLHGLSMYSYTGGLSILVGYCSLSLTIIIPDKIMYTLCLGSWMVIHM